MPPSSYVSTLGISENASYPGPLTPWGRIVNYFSRCLHLPSAANRQQSARMPRGIMGKRRGRGFVFSKLDDGSGYVKGR